MRFIRKTLDLFAGAGVLAATKVRLAAEQKKSTLLAQQTLTLSERLARSTDETRRLIDIAKKLERERNEARAGFGHAAQVELAASVGQLTDLLAETREALTAERFDASEAKLLLGAKPDETLIGAARRVAEEARYPIYVGTVGVGGASGAVIPGSGGGGGGAGGAEIKPETGHGAADDFGGTDYGTGDGQSQW